jgi:hypothetical protein
MKKSKHCSKKGEKYRRLSKKEYEEIFEPREKKEWTPPVEESNKLLKMFKDREEEWYTFSHRSIEITVFNFSCDRHDCNRDVEHVFTTSLYDIDWTKIRDSDVEELRRREIEYNKKRIDKIKRKTDPLSKGYDKNFIMYSSESLEELEEDVRQNIPHFFENAKSMMVYFACSEHILRVLNGAFGGGGRLNNHYVKRKGNNQFVYFQDKWFLKNPQERDMDRLKTEFTLTRKNYKTVMRSIGDKLISKRNFSFYYLPHKSMRKTGFCTLCEIPPGSIDDECPEFQEIEKEKCKCGHRKELHYFDREWDEEFEKYGQRI